MASSPNVETRTGAELAPDHIDLTDLDHFAKGAPHALFARLRRERPVHWNPERDGTGFWSVTRHADVFRVSRDSTTFSSIEKGIMIFEPPADVRVDSWPATVSVAEDWYFRPDAGRLMASPADETPVPPQDVQPEEIDLAEAAHRIEQATTLKITRIVNKWAGLRSFVTDKSPVAGFAPDAEGFIWLAGQGGYGIKTAPALARVTAALVTGGAFPADLAELGLSAADLAPERLWA